MKTAAMLIAVFVLAGCSNAYGESDFPAAEVWWNTLTPEYQSRFCDLERKAGTDEGASVNDYLLLEKPLRRLIGYRSVSRFVNQKCGTSHWEDSSKEYQF